MSSISSTPLSSTDARPVDEDLQAAIRLFRTNDDFRSELKSVISESLQPLVLKIKAELLSELSPQDISVSNCKKLLKPAFNPSNYIYREFPYAEVTAWTYYDTEGFVYGFPEEITVTVFTQNSVSYLCNFKDVVNAANVIFLIRVGKLYKTVNQVKSLSCVIICRHIDPKAKLIADRCKMKTVFCNP